MSGLWALVLAVSLQADEPVAVTVAPLDQPEAPQPAREYLHRGKVTLGATLEGSDPRTRDAVYRDAEAHFEHVIDRAIDSTPDERAEARDFLRAIHAEHAPNKIPEKAVTLRALVLMVGIEAEVQKFDRKKFNDLSQKSRNKRDPAEYQRILAQCTTRVPVKTTFTSDDEKYVKRKVDEASRLLFEWSRGRLNLDATIDKLPARIAPSPERTDRRGFWPPVAFTGPTRDRPEEQLLALVNGRRGPLPDVLVLIPKYERGDDVLPGPTDSQELDMRYPPIYGRLAVAHARLYYPPTEAAPSDGNARIVPMEERLVIRIFRGIEPLILRNLGNPHPDYRGDFVSGAPVAVDLLPDLRRPLKVGYQELAMGPPLLREVLSNYLTQDMAAAAVRSDRDFDVRRDLTFSRVSSPPPGALFDGDLDTAYRYAKLGDLVSVELSRPTSVSGISFYSDAGEPMPRGIEVTYGDGMQSWRFSYDLDKAPLRAQRIRLPATVSMKTLDVKLLSVHGNGSGAGLREIVLN